MKIVGNSIVIEFDENQNKLLADGEEVIPDIRKLLEMKDVVFNKNFINEENRNDIIYYMFRGTGYGKNDGVFKAHNVRYDVTVILPYNLGGEFNKTLGHYHAIAEDGMSFPEIYEILSGKAVYLIQKDNGDGSFDVKLINANKGDRVIMPPNYGHISINVGEEPLIEANLVSTQFQSNYEPIKKMNGGALYLTNDGNIIINKNYKKLTVSIVNAEKIEFLNYSYKTLYDEFIAHPEHFDFLNHPKMLIK